MKRTFGSAPLMFILCLLLGITGFANTYTYNIPVKEVHNGYYSAKVWLNNDEMPEVVVTGVVLTPGVQLPADALAVKPQQIKLAMGMDRKRPFVVVRIPVYSVGEDNTIVNRLSTVTIEVTEKNSAVQRTTSGTTYAANSVLATGTWYKIGVTQTGFYKIDYSFLSSMGLTPSIINPANIRIFGNGGHMLSENNSDPRADDLIENAISVTSATGTSFGTNDYVIFYGVGTTNWFRDSANQRFIHQNNLYADTAYYFITVDNGAGLRIANQAALGTANVNSNSYNYYDRHELDAVNPTSYGKWWFGEEFNSIAGNLTQTFNFNTGNALLGTVHATVNMASTCDVSGNYTSFSVNNVPGGTTGPAYATTTDQIMDTNIVSATLPCSTNSVNVAVTFIPADENSALTVGYLYYIEINGRVSLNMVGNQLSFRDWQTVGAGNIASYSLGGANSSTQVWDVTNPQVPTLMQGTLSGSTYTFSQDASMLHEFAAMNSTNLYTPTYIGPVPNQNLHGLTPAQLVIVTVPEFMNAAKKLGDYHQAHDGFNYAIATTQQIYNEFSSGGQDISAIRDFARMLYKKAAAGDAPKYLVLFGGASYDYKYRISGNSNLVPVFESAEFTNDLTSYSTDDFFGFLDDGEYIENTSKVNVLDVGIGRLPARSVAAADSIVDKIISYTTPQALGPWRIADMFAACRDDGAGNHMEVAELMAGRIDSDMQMIYNETKVYEDAIPVVSTPAGDRCPQANSEIDQQIFNGTFMTNYNGHGNTQVWSAERILTSTDYNSWTNRFMLPFMVTATCDFGQFDHPQTVSAAEQVLLLNGGGSIAMLTTTQSVFSSYNQEINGSYVDSQYTPIGNGQWRTFGDAYIAAKNQYYVSSTSADQLLNFRKFALLGDPALTPDFPKYKISVDSIVDGATMTVSDTLSALGKYFINGSVRDYSGNVLSGFNGNVWVSVYDKPTTILPIDDGGFPYPVQSSVIYRGIATVTNGQFSVEFITPKDINYYFGHGKISTYADDNVTDAAGADLGHAIGGFSNHPVLSNEPPIVHAYINDSFFINGGITGTNTSLYVVLYDQTGINVSGNVIGHDLVAILDGNTETPYVLNDYYQTAPNSYQRGFVNFPVFGLADGKHNFRITAWDVNDNYGVGSVDFTVVDGQVVDIQSLMNYPNPFSNTTNFVFEHNHPFELATVKIDIYNTQGACVKKIVDNVTLPDSRTMEVSWDGRGDNGALLPSGVYVYQFELTTEAGIKSSAYQKLVIVR